MALVCPGANATRSRCACPDTTHRCQAEARGRASLPIDSGVIGFAPGTKVTLIEQVDLVSTVTDGEYQFKVPSSQLTNDLDLAASVASADYAAQAQIAELTAKRAQEYSQQQRDAFIASEKEKAQKKTGKKTSRRPSPTPKR